MNVMEIRLSTSNLTFLPRSLVSCQEVEYGLASIDKGFRLVILARQGDRHIGSFEGEASEFDGATLLVCPPNHRNLTSLQGQLGWLKPQRVGLSTSAGMGDRLGIATPGHVRAVRHFRGNISPIFAQQSIREMKRTGRSPQQVMDEAVWGVFEGGWQDGFGADADHLKTKQDIAACFEAGYTWYTMDPGDYVNNFTAFDNNLQVKGHIAELPAELQPGATGLLGASFDINGYQASFPEPVLFRAILKYGRAVAHVAAMYEYLAGLAGDKPFEVEVSMDETNEPTSPEEHIYIASELRRLGVKWISFAPRFIGRFEKGVDYLGDVDAFADSLATHAAIARQFGPYKVSLHSGSDKFSIYSAFMQATGGLAHLKTAGTSYLEALRTIAVVDSNLFKEIYAFAREHYERDKASYHVSARLEKAPLPEAIGDGSAVLDQFDGREILHVTFGSVLAEKTTGGSTRFYDRMMALLGDHREAYFRNLEKHFIRHLRPFSVKAGG
jgi:hypothetical protein